MSSVALIPDLNSLWVFMLILTRIGAALSMLPAFGMQAVPMRLRLGLAASLSLLVFVYVLPKNITPIASPNLVSAFMSEAALGLALGFFVKLVVEAVNFGASVIGFQMGFSIVNVIDPMSGGNVSIIGSFLGLAAGIIFVVSGLYRLFIGGLVDSFLKITPGGAAFSESMGGFFLQAGAHLFVTSISVAAPVMLSLFLAKIALGIVARTVPQMNIFIVGLPMTIWLGLVLIGLALPFMVHAILGAYDQSADVFRHFVQASAR